MYRYRLSYVFIFIRVSIERMNTSINIIVQSLYEKLISNEHTAQSTRNSMCTCRQML